MDGAHTIDGSGQRAQFELSDQQRLDWLRLYRSENVGPATFRDLINHCGSARTALAMLPDLAARGGRNSRINIANEEDAARELEAIKKSGAKLVGIGEPTFPRLLRMADSPPPLVTIKGDVSVFQKPAVAIVGSRNASMAGIKMARMIAGGLAENGHAVVSGLARGIDKAAHEASIKSGTIAVLAGGINRPYPPENLNLLAQIESASPSAAISEMPFDWEPRARDFPKRNRIIAALSLGLVVVEAASRSGSLISARLAGELGRLVMAVPGSPLDPRAQGTNGLIRDGATLITNADDVLEAISPILDSDRVKSPVQSSFLEPDDTMSLPAPQDAREHIISLLSPTPTNIDDIIAESGVAPSQVFLTLLELDLAGRIERHSGNRLSLLAADT